MTIRELEQRTGLERANIRFYEKEGLLDPARRENGYRDYSEEDLRMLRRICLPRLRAPWRRYWARILDLNLYSLLWSAFLVFGLKVNLLRMGGLLAVLCNVAPLGLMLVLEPAFLRGFGTTPGKAILGFRLEHENGRRLTYPEGLNRTWQVILRGMGLGIPIYSLYRCFKSYGTCMGGELLAWEGLGEAELTLKDTRVRRTVLYVLAALLVPAADIGLHFVLPAPPNRGEITVEAFAENYNFYAAYYKDNFWNKKLNEEGEWADASTDIVYQFPASFRWPDFIFEEEDGILTGVTVRVEFDGGGELMDTFQMQELIAALAFAGASEDAHPSAWTALRLEKRLAVQENGSLSFEEAGTEFSLYTEMENYSQWSADYLMGRSEEACYLREFSMRYAE